MVKIEAVIQPYTLNTVHDALNTAGITEMTAYEVKGGGDKAGHGLYRGAEYAVDFLPRVKLELVVAEKDQDRVVAVLQRAASTGKGGDGEIFVYPIGQTIPIGAAGSAARGR